MRSDAIKELLTRITAGGWETIPGDGSGRVYIEGTSTPILQALTPTGLGFSEQMANADLAAAAPVFAREVLHLREALTACVAHIEAAATPRGRKTMEQRLAVVKKARAALAADPLPDDHECLICEMEGPEGHE